MDQMLIWTFIHREYAWKRTRTDRRPVDFIDIYEDNSSTLGLFGRVGRILHWARTRRASRKSTCDSGQQEKMLAAR